VGEASGVDVSSRTGGSARSFAAGTDVESDVGEAVVVFVTGVEAGRVVRSPDELEVSNVVDGTLSGDVVEMSAASRATDVLALAEVELDGIEEDEGSSSVRLIFIPPYPSSSRKTDADARPESTETPKSTRGIICAVTEPLSVVEPPIESCNGVWPSVCDAWPVLFPSS